MPAKKSPVRAFLVKQEPSDYSWNDFVRDGSTAWTGVRNYAARLHLRSMQPGDAVLFYHSGEGKEIVGVARVKRAAYLDPTGDPAEEWAAVDLEPVCPFKRPVTLITIKADKALKEIELVRQSRLSVMPLRPGEYARLLELGGL
ncbi:MAG TPA: EVE domain-containing protein [Candidatus Didemnitutus sp.]|jgi:predicted RNA-binding protein with PUA-like domain